METLHCQSFHFNQINTTSKFQICLYFVDNYFTKPMFMNVYKNLPLSPQMPVLLNASSHILIGY